MKLFFRVLFGVYIAILLWMSLSSPSGLVKFAQDYSGFRLDYTLHVIGFIPMPLFSYFSSDNASNRLIWRVFVVMSFILCIVLEYVQMFTPGRRFNPLDMVFNIMGVIIGLVITCYVHRYAASLFTKKSKHT